MRRPQVVNLDSEVIYGGGVDILEGLFMFPSVPQCIMGNSLAPGYTTGIASYCNSNSVSAAPVDDVFLAPWMTATMSDVEDEYFDDLDDEDFDDEFDDDFEEELDDDLAALNPEVTEEDLVEADDDLGGMFDDEEGGSSGEPVEPGAEPEDEP